MTFGVPPPPPEVLTLDDASLVQPQTPPSISSFTIEVSPSEFDPATNARSPSLANINTIDGSPPGVVLSHVSNSSAKKDKRKLDTTELIGCEWKGWRSEMQSSGLPNWESIKAINAGISRPSGPTETPWGRRAEQIKIQKAKRDIVGAEDELKPNMQTQTSTVPEQDRIIKSGFQDAIKGISDTAPVIKLQALPGQNNNQQNAFRRRSQVSQPETAPRSYKPPPTPVFTPPPTPTLNSPGSSMVQSAEVFRENAQLDNTRRAAGRRAESHESAAKIKLEATEISIDKPVAVSTDQSNLATKNAKRNTYTPQKMISEGKSMFPPSLTYKFDRSNPNQPMLVTRHIPGITTPQRKTPTARSNTPANSKDSTPYVNRVQSTQSQSSSASTPGRPQVLNPLRSSRTSDRVSRSVQPPMNIPVPEEPPSIVSSTSRPSLATRLAAARLELLEANRLAAAEADKIARQPLSENSSDHSSDRTSPSAPVSTAPIVEEVRPEPPSIILSPDQQPVVLAGSQQFRHNLKDLIHDKPSISVQAPTAPKAQLPPIKASKPRIAPKPTPSMPKVIKRREISLQENDDEPEKKGFLSKIFGFFTGKK